jgi:cytidylate kinase
MNKKHIITIAGKLGSGKSSTAKRVSEILNYTHYSTGDFMRSLANERNISLADLNKFAETDKSIDSILDERNKKTGEEKDVVLDSRLGFYFIPDSFKVFLELDSDTSSERILNDKKDNLNRSKESSGNFDTKEEIKRNIEDRLESERKRYKEMYNIDNHTDHNNFDLVINTKDLPLEEVSRKVVEEYHKWLVS